MKTFYTLLLSLFFVITSSAQESLQVEKTSKFSISAGVGFGFRTAEIAPSVQNQQREHEKEMLSGLSYFVMPRYQLNDSYSIGITYRAFSSTAVTNNYGLFIDGVTIDHIDEERKIFFVGPTLHYHNISDVNELNISISLGYIGFKSESILNRINIPMTMTGGNLGIELGLEYLWKLAPNFYAGASIGYTLGTLTKINVEFNGVSQEVKFDDNEKESLEFISINPVLRLYL